MSDLTASMEPGRLPAAERVPGFVVPLAVAVGLAVIGLWVWEAVPPGVYAVTESSADAQPGVVFFLRQRNVGNAGSRQRPSSLVHPFYFAYIHNGGNIRFGCGNARQTLAVFEAAVAGQTSPITELCDRF